MKPTLLALAILGVALAAGCDRREMAENQPTPQPSETADAPTATDADPSGTTDTYADASATGTAQDGSAMPPNTTDADGNRGDAAPAGSNPADAGATAQDANGTMPGGSDAAAGGGDGAALGLLGAVNQHEIDAARQAQKKGVDGDVLEFAKMMETDHGTNQDRVRSLGAMAETADVKAQKDKGAKELAMLDKSSGEAYEKAYIDAMVKGHQDALNAIDNKMLPAATTDAVRQHLTTTRAAVAKHLERAKEIDASQK